MSELLREYRRHEMMVYEPTKGNKEKGPQTALKRDTAFRGETSMRIESVPCHAVPMIH
jgi:hypothetical protein